MNRLNKKTRDVIMGDEQFRKYLIYAIGEILLVVVGILIALQVNNWNMDRLESQQERELLESVVESLREDSLLVIKVKEDIRQIDELHRSLYEYSEGELEEDNIQNLGLLTQTLFFNPVTMINYPELANNVLDPELKESVRFYYQKMDDVYFVVDNFNVHMEDVFKPFLGEMELYNYGYRYRNPDADPTETGDVILKEFLLDMLSDPLLQQMLFSTEMKYTQSSQLLDEMQTESAIMVRQITQYLND